MDLSDWKSTTSCHLVALPYPGRGHVNPMMNLCKLLASKKQDLLITFVVTEEWLAFIGSDTKFSNIKFAPIPNVLPSELVRGLDFPGFYEAVMTKMQVPFEKVLDQLEILVNAIIADTELLWAIPAANKRNIPVAALCTFPVTVFSALHSFSHIKDLQKLVGFLAYGDELEEHVQGISSAQVAEFRTIFYQQEGRVMQLAIECISKVQKAQYLIFNSVYELESREIDTMKEKFQVPIFPVGPAIPYFELEDNSSVTMSSHSLNYFKWLDSQPTASVLYVSLGCFLSISNDQMDEIAGGLRKSGVRYIWVVRGGTSQLDQSSGDKGIVLPWCNQLKVLCHPSIGGFWTHCGWNSTLEAVYAGVPMLTFPILFDQVPNSKKIVEKWRIGWRVKNDEEKKSLVTRAEIAEVVQKFMDTDNSEAEEIRIRARELQEMCRQATIKGGSSDNSLDSLLKDISMTRP